MKREEELRERPSSYIREGKKHLSWRRVTDENEENVSGRGILYDTCCYWDATQCLLSRGDRHEEERKEKNQRLRSLSLSYKKGKDGQTLVTLLKISSFRSFVQ